MSFLAVLVLFGFILDCAKTCKPVSYKFKQYKAQQYGYGCKKGCFGFANTTECLQLDGTTRPGCFDRYGRIAEDNHYKQDKCVECKTIDANFAVASYIQNPGYDPNNGFPATVPVGAIVTINDTELEKACNGWTAELLVNDILSSSITRGYLNSNAFFNGKSPCFWNSKKGECVASSCPNMVAREKCNGNWTEGKCTKPDYHITSFYPYNGFSGSFSSTFYLSGAINSTSYGCRSYLDGNLDNRVNTSDTSNPNYRWVTCDDLEMYYHTQKKLNQDYECVKFTAEHVKECKYLIDHPGKRVNSYSYEYTKGGRKECHQLYGCLYASNSYGQCSTWSIWAFVLTLIILILVVVGAVVVFLIVAHFVLKLF